MLIAAYVGAVVILGIYLTWAVGKSKEQRDFKKRLKDSGII